VARVEDDVIDLRLGRYQDVLTDVECDCLIVDAPYSERTHESHDASANGHLGAGKDSAKRQTINYDRWTPEQVGEFCGFWHERARGWFVTIPITRSRPYGNGYCRASAVTCSRRCR